MDREAIVPATMQNIVTQKGYVPAMRVGQLLFVAGQVGRTPDLQVIADPEAQFVACWENLRTVLAAAGCDFGDIVDLTTFHVDMAVHQPGLLCGEEPPLSAGHLSVDGDRRRDADAARPAARDQGDGAGAVAVTGHAPPRAPRTRRRATCSGSFQVGSVDCVV